MNDFFPADTRATKTNRSPIDCMRHGLQRMGHIWDPDSDNRLMECVETYGLDNWNLGDFSAFAVIFQLTGT